MTVKQRLYFCTTLWMILYFFLSSYLVFAQNSTVTQNFTHDGIKQKSATFADSTQANTNFWRQLVVNTDNEIIAVSSPAEDHGSFWLHNHPGNDPFINPKPSSVTFDNKQIENVFSKKYIPVFSGNTKNPSGSGGNSNNPQSYTWTVTGEYTIKCTEKCGKIEEEVEVPVGYDMTTDKMHIKRLFENLLHYGAENCNCPKHTINWPQTITADFDVKCNHFGNPCEKMGKIKAVAVDFYLDIIPDATFPDRSKSRLGLLEKATVVAKSVVDDSTLTDVTFSLVSGDNFLDCDGETLTAKTVAGFAKIKGTHSSGKASTAVVGVVKPSGMTFIEDDINRTVSNRQEYIEFIIPPPEYVTDTDYYICGFRSRFVLLPEDVSFNKLAFKEINVNPPFDTFLTPPLHSPDWQSIPIPQGTVPGTRLGDKVGGYIPKIVTARSAVFEIRWMFCDEDKKGDTSPPPAELASFTVFQKYFFSGTSFTVSKENKQHTVP